MRKLYFLFFLTIGFLGNAQIVNIPDAQFKLRLLQANPNYFQIASTAPNIGAGSPSYYSNIDTNNDNEIQVSEAMQIKWLNISSAQISDLTGIEAFKNLINLNCGSNFITNADFSENINLRFLTCNHNYNQISSIDISQNILLRQLSLGSNQLPSIDISNLVLLENFYCSSNLLTNLDISQNANLKILFCDNNQLINLDVSQNNDLGTFICTNNLITSLDISQNNLLTHLNCSQNQLYYLNIKNSRLPNYWYNLDFSNNSTLEYICADQDDIVMVQQKINDYGYTSTCHTNPYCSFTPNGIFYEISGNSKFDSNNNGCDGSDINYSNLNFSITDGTNTGSMISNQTGNYYIPVQAGNHTITPNLENPSYFNISPTSFTVDFPTQVSPFNQDFCVTANGVHSDVEIILVPTTPARPGFDADYKLVYRNKGNQIENGSVSLAFDDAKLDYVSSNPVFNSTAVNNFTWNYTNLQPFETREIEIVFNVNSPMETPAVNNGDQIDFLAQITPFTNDEEQSDNISALKQIVVGSYDPNDKTCLQGETIPPSEVGKYVHYVIRFENTGTFPAENIVVKT